MLIYKVLFDVFCFVYCQRRVNKSKTHQTQIGVFVTIAMLSPVLFKQAGKIACLNDIYFAAWNACSKSAKISWILSIPQERRIKPAEIPTFSNSTSLN